MFVTVTVSHLSPIFASKAGVYPRTTTTIIEQVALNKSSLLQKNILQNTQTLQLFTKVIKMPSWQAWAQRKSGLIEREWHESQTLTMVLQNCLMKVENVS